jgi:NADP-dependent 3-hydroxy acid dehydrogenase YdfG
LHIADNVDQTAIVAGASKGLGRCIASELVTRGKGKRNMSILPRLNSIPGANVHLLARGQTQLEATKVDLTLLRYDLKQWIQTHVVDLGDHVQVI